MTINQDCLDLSHHFSNPNIISIFSYKSFLANGIEGRKNLAHQTGFNPNSLLNPKQTHSTNVVLWKKPGSVMDTDGIFTSNPKLVCSIQVADCMPVYFAHKNKPFFGLVHAGWRGLVHGILLQSAKCIKENEKALSDFDVLIGPSIQNCCFEVSDDVIDQFDSRFVEKKEDGKYRIDLQKMALSQLVKSGFQSEKITILNECTFCNEDKYHSYRRNGNKAGRMIGLLGMK
jgi:hypothetical protein